MKYYFTLILIVMILVSLSLFNSSSYGIEWKNYTNELFSMQIPSNWNVTEKQNRFEDPTASDLLITNPNNKNQSFDITDHVYAVSKDISLHGLEQSLFARAEFYKILGDIEVVDGPDLSQFNISGSPTGTITMVNKANEVVNQDFYVDRNGKASLIAYTNSVDQFDSPESQEILNHMIASIKFN